MHVKVTADQPKVLATLGCNTYIEVEDGLELKLQLGSIRERFEVWCGFSVYASVMHTLQGQVIFIEKRPANPAAHQCCSRCCVSLMCSTCECGKKTK
jgi:hypothetical protein